MNIAHTKLHGIDQDRLLAAVDPVLRAHNVEGVELVWRTDRGDWVLELTVERSGSRFPGDGITIDVCSEISRDLSTALDVADVIPNHYRLEVGSPGLERALYAPEDYERFAGQKAQLKLRRLVSGQRVLQGVLHGLNESGSVLLGIEEGDVNIEAAAIESARLVFDWNKAPDDRPNKAGRVRRRAAGRRRSARRPKRSR